MDADPQVLWRALAVSRAVLLAYALVVNAMHADDYERPVLAWTVLGVLAAWTAAAPRLYIAAALRPRLIGAEFALACGALLLTPLAQGSDVLERDLQSVPSFWIAAPVLAAAIAWGWPGGLAGALGEAAVDVTVRAEATATTASNIFLLIVAGLIVGYASALVRISTQERAAAAASRAATAERDRLSRAVHDGVLQALSYVQRRGTEIGGAATELAELAAEQEEALRGLVRGGDPLADAPSELHDVAAMLHLQAGRSVSVASPSEPVRLPAHAATELVAAVRAALDNTARHAGGATAYVLVEDEGAMVVVSVGDDGPGIPAGRLDEAETAGRMGVAHSIRSRLADLGGTAELTTGPTSGTEWELRVPRGAATSAGSRS